MLSNLNVFFTQVEKVTVDNYRLKLGDFGLAMLVTEPVFTICGTPTYVAPEILCETGGALLRNFSLIFIAHLQRRPYVWNCQTY